MKRYKYTFILCLITALAAAQPTFKSIDTLLAKNFEAVNLEDSAYYVSLLNHAAIYKGKKLKNKTDSLNVLKPFTKAFNDMIDQLTELTGNNDTEVKFENYKSTNIKDYDAKVNGKILVHVNLLINNTFIVTVPFMIIACNGTYAIETPMIVMIVDN